MAFPPKKNGKKDPAAGKSAPTKAFGGKGKKKTAKKK